MREEAGDWWRALLSGDEKWTQIQQGCTLYREYSYRRLPAGRKGIYSTKTDKGDFMQG